MATEADSRQGLQRGLRKRQQVMHHEGHQLEELEEREEKKTDEASPSRYHRRWCRYLYKPARAFPRARDSDTALPAPNCVCAAGGFGSALVLVLVVTGPPRGFINLDISLQSP